MNMEGSINSDRLDYVWDNHVQPFYELVSQYYMVAHEQELVRTYPPAVFFFLLSHGATAIIGSRALARKIMSMDLAHMNATQVSKAESKLADPDEIALRAEFVADLLLVPPK